MFLLVVYAFCNFIPLNAKKQMRTTYSSLHTKGAPANMYKRRKLNAGDGYIEDCLHERFSALAACRHFDFFSFVQVLLNNFL